MTESEIEEDLLLELASRLLGDEDSNYMDRAMEHFHQIFQGDSELNIRTCSDFKYLNVECCATCHGFAYPFNMDLVNVQGGGKAWVCCSLARVLDPARIAARQEGEDFWMDELIKTFKRPAHEKPAP